MPACPICNTAAQIETATSGDFKVFDCRRCGRYKITGTALEMLPRRISERERFSARLSYAVRTASDAEGELPVLSSVNLDQLGERRLPSIEAQIHNLLNWIRCQIDDDELEAVDIGDRDALCGVLGAVNAERVDDVIKLASEQGVIQYFPYDSVAITQIGWKMLRQPADERPSDPAPTEETSVGTITKADCNECGPSRNAHVRAGHTVSQTDDDGSSSSDTWEIVECCGCGAMSIRRRFWFSEWDTVTNGPDGRPMIEYGVKETYFPGRTRRKRPPWTEKISDPILRKLFDELYSALGADLLIVSSICARTLFDAASNIKVGDCGGFKKSINELHKQGMISSDEREALEAMTDAGNASAHRGYEPNFEQLTHIVDIVESFIQRQFMYADVVKSLRSSTPQHRFKRPPKDKPID